MEFLDEIEAKLKDHVVGTDNTMKLLRKETMARISEKEDSSDRIIR